MASLEQDFCNNKDKKMLSTLESNISCESSQNPNKFCQPLKSVEATPTKTHDVNAPTTNSFSEKALEVQKTLQSSLTMSLRKEAEMKPKLHTPTSEILREVKSVTGRVAEKSASRALNFSNSTLSDANLSNLSSPEKKAMNSNDFSKPQIPSPLNGPNICLSTQFPSGLSPIKPYSTDTDDQSLIELSQLQKDFDEDPSTKKLMDFMLKLEKGSVTDGTLAERMNQLSFLLKNSSLNSGSRSDAEEAKVSNQFASPQHPITRENNQRENSTKSLFTSNQNKTSSSKKTNRIDTTVSSQRIKSKPTSVSSVMQLTNSKSVHFSQGNKPESKTLASKTNHKFRKSKSAKPVNEPTVPTGSVSIHHSKEPTEEKVIVKSPSKPIQEINSIRNNLHAMMNLHKQASLDTSDCGDNLVGGHDSKDDEDTLGSSDTATLLQAQPSEMFNVSPTKLSSDELTDGLTSELFSILKSGANKQAGHSNRSSIDSTVTTEIGILRDTLEKETYRRKHCEKQIQTLQRKVLEVQQELAVSHSTDRKKDIMIEQLDKTLAKVVQGWKVHEANLVKTIADYASEKQKTSQEMIKLKELVVNLENELAKVLEELVEEKEHVLRLEDNEKAIQRSYTARAEEIAQLIDQKNGVAHKQQKKIDQLVSERKKLQCRIDDLSEELKIQGKTFAEKEANWEEAVVDIEKRQKDLLEKEKSFTDHERQRCTTIQSALSSTEQDVTRLQSLLEAQRGEVESLHTQMDVMETKHQSDIKRLEAEHKMNVERRLMDKLAQVHEESQETEARIRENHKKQMLDLMSSHKRELESQCRRYEDELQKRDEIMRQTIANHKVETNEKMKLKSEEMRVHMMNKMQNLLQTHYNETLQVVGNTTGVTPQRPPVISNDVTMLQSLPANESLMLPTSLSKTIEQEPQQLLGTSFPVQQSSVIKPVPTMPSYQHKSAFSSTSFVSPPSISSSQPLMSHSNSYQPISTNFTSQGGNLENEFQPVHSVAKHSEPVESVPNLSLISSIGHGTLANGPSHVQQPSKNVDFVSESPMKDRHVGAVFVPTGNDSMIAKTSEDMRKTHLQHYVQMLLQRSPGDPVETSTVEPSPNHGRKLEDKENIDAKRIMSTAQSGVVLQQIHQQNKVSPDVIPLKHPNLAQLVQVDPFSTHKSLMLEKKKASNVRFAQDTTTAVASAQSSVKPVATSANFLSPLQVGEISQILDLYSTTATPTGETRLAAEQILRYLRDTNSAMRSETSVQPTNTSSPAKKTKQQVKNVDVLAPGGKSCSKIGTSPAKANPVWR